MPHKILYSVDLKDMEANKCYLVYEIIAKHRKERHVIWGSGNEEAHAKLLELDPDIPRYYNAFSLIMTYIWYLFGCLFCFKLENDLFGTPIMTKQ